MKVQNILTGIIVILALLLNSSLSYSQTEVVIGNETSSTELYPFNGNYNYSWANELYTSSEVNASGYITKVSFYVDNSPSNYTMTNQKIYVKHTTTSNYSDANYPGTTGFTLVYEGSITYNGSGWKTITLNTPFKYNGTDNLELLFESRDGSSASGYPLFRYTSGLTNYQVRRDRKSTEFPTTCYSCARLQNKLNIKLYIEPCVKPNANAGLNTSICEGASVQIGGNPTATGGVAPYTYTWIPSTGLNNNTIANPTASPSANTTYKLLVGESEGCVSDTQQVTVSVGDANTAFYTSTNKTYQICSGKFYDNGGATGSYTNSTNYTVTFEPCNNLKSVSINFTSFDIESSSSCSYDYLKIYNGPNTSSPLIGTYCGTTSPGLITSTHLSGALTFEFKSDVSGNGAGWSANISCLTNCSNVAGTASLLNAGDGCSSGVAQLQLSNNAGTFVTWEKSYNNVNYTDISGSTNNYSELVNRKTYYKAKVTSNGDVCYSNILTYVTGNNYYVNDANTSNDIYSTVIGNNSNDGLTPQTPKASVNEIINNYDLGSCDTIFVDAGTYNEDISITGSDYGSTKGNIIIIGAGKDKTIVHSTTNDNIIFNTTKYVQLENIRLQNSNTSARYNAHIYRSRNITIKNCDLENNSNHNIYVYGYSGDLNQDADSNNIVGCTINNTNIDGKAIYVKGDCDYDIIENNTITTTGTGSAYGIYLLASTYSNYTLWPTRSIIRNNTITVDDYGIVLNGLVEELALIKIYDNTINVLTQDKVKGSAILLIDIGEDAEDLIEIYNNRLIGGRIGLYFDGEVRYTKIYNNYISGQETGIYVSSYNDKYHKVYFNSFYNTKNNIYFDDNGSNSDWDLRNNIFYTTSSVSTQACLNILGTSYFVACDNNLYYAPNGAKIAIHKEVSHSTLASFQAADHTDGTVKGDENSKSGNPCFRLCNTLTI